jgi:hypothetical protein
VKPREKPGPARIPFGVVKRFDNHVELTVSLDDLDVGLFERWVRERIIDKIPGATDQPEVES